MSKCKQGELDEEIVALREYQESDEYAQLSWAKRRLIVAQVHAMENYSEILTLRRGVV